MIESFKGDYSFLSNFHPTWQPFVTVDGRVVSAMTAEHAFQASKTKDAEQQRAILRAATPGIAKRLGRAVTLREDWDAVKVDIMEAVLRVKFADGRLEQRLLETYPQVLIEGNTWGDKFWGICGSEGKNMLGHLLMKIRMDIVINQ